MPIYTFLCSSCSYEDDVSLTFSEFDTLPKKSKCPACKKKQFVRQFAPSTSFSVKNDPSTVGHQAVRNTENMGHYELQDRRAKDAEEKERNEEKLAEKLPSGMSIPKRNPDAIWYGEMDRKKKKEIFKEKDKKEQKKKIKKYVLEGK